MSITQLKMIHLPEELGEEVECEVTFHVENNGIGWYEYWGQKCFDAGENYAEIDDIIPQWDDQKSEEKEMIKKYIDDNWDAVCDDVVQRIDWGE